jgi:glycosyltransferase involved in cell wall biosynthesis
VLGLRAIDRSVDAKHEYFAKSEIAVVLCMFPKQLGTVNAMQGIHVLHVASWLSRLSAGVSRVAIELGKSQLERDHYVRWACLKDTHFEEDIVGNEPDLAGRVTLIGGWGPQRLRWAPLFGARALRQNASSQIIHVHGIWSSPCRSSARAARKGNCPYVVVIHGMLDPWAIGFHSVRKAPFIGQVRRMLDRAACIHAGTMSEVDDIRRFGVRSPIAVIPNGVSLSDYQVACTPFARVGEGDSRKRLLFLSRIHPKKGLMLLIEAWSRVSPQFPNWYLSIGGPDEVGFEKTVQLRVEELGVSSSVEFAGPLYGSVKGDMLNSSEAFILPSLSEGFSLAILEAMACSLPVIITKACHFPEVQTARAGVIAGADIEALEAALKSMLGMSASERREMGAKGKALVERDYTWSRVARQTEVLYEWILRGGAKPDFVSC